MQHPSRVQYVGGYHNQMGFLDDIKSWGQSQIDKYIDEPLRDLGESVGLSQEEIDRIAAETNKAYEKELQQKQQELLASITGQTNQQASAGPSYTQQLQTQIANLQNQLEQSVPGGMTTVYAVGGAMGALVLYKIFAGPK